MQTYGLSVPVSGPYVAHINRCFNGFTQIAGEDARSHKLNQEGLAIQMQWLYQDLAPLLYQKIPDKLLGKYSRLHTELTWTLQNLQTAKNVLTTQENAFFQQEEIQPIKRELDHVNEKIDDLIIEINGLQEGDEDKLKDLSESLKQLNEEQKALQKNLKAGFKEDQKALHENIALLEKQVNIQLENLRDTLQKLEKTIDEPELQTKFHIATRILELQTAMNSASLSPAQEIGYQLLLDHILGAVTEINCKSGIDRTGFVRAFHNVIQQKLQEGSSLSDLVKLIDTFETKVKLMDASIEAQQEPFDFSTWLKNEGSEFQEIFDFQARLFDELMSVARPITGRSTGIEGLKWHHDKKSLNPFEKNPHPLPYLPMFVMSEGQRIQLIQITSSGQRKLTPEGNALLMGLSSRRGG